MIQRPTERHAELVAGLTQAGDLLLQADSALAAAEDSIDGALEHRHLLRSIACSQLATVQLTHRAVLAREGVRAVAERTEQSEGEERRLRVLVLRAQLAQLEVHREWLSVTSRLAELATKRASEVANSESGIDSETLAWSVDVLREVNARDAIEVRMMESPTS